MLTYNTRLTPLIMPEYGRNIQRMVDLCIKIENRDERTACAYSIVEAMAKLFPELKSPEGYSHKLWDHLMIMSGFKLDIDFPCTVVSEESLHTLPEPVAYDYDHPHLRHYGQNIERMIQAATAMPPGEEKDELIRLIANHMKKMMMSFNAEGTSDERVFNDLRIMSHGAILVTVDDLKLRDYVEPPKPTGKKKKKK